jgi:hypothetical protein
LEGQAREKYDRLVRLSSERNWYRDQYDTLDALVEALRTDNGWLEYRLQVVQDELLEQDAQAVKNASAVTKVHHLGVQKALGSVTPHPGVVASQRMRLALHLGVQKALSVVASHYQIDLEAVSMGYVVPVGVDNEVVMNCADALAAPAADILTDQVAPSRWPQQVAPKPEDHWAFVPFMLLC